MDFHDTDDYSDLPLDAIGAEGFKPAPKPRESAMASFQSQLSQIGAKPGLLGKGRAIVGLHEAGKSDHAIAKKVGLSQAEVASVTSTYQQLETPAEKKVFKQNVPNRDSVFNLEVRLQELYEHVIEMLDLADDFESRLGVVSEIRQLYKLAKEVLQDVTFKERDNKKKKEETDLILAAVSRLEPAHAATLFKDIQKIKSTLPPGALDTYEVEGAEGFALEEYSSGATGSVFDLYARLQELYKILDKMMASACELEDKIGTAGELRQLYKLAKDVQVDVNARDEASRRHAGEIRILLMTLYQKNPDVAFELRDALQTLRASQ